MIAVEFLRDRGSRRAGDVVKYDDNSAAAIVAEGAAKFVDEPDFGVVELPAEPEPEPEPKRPRRSSKPAETGA